MDMEEGLIKISEINDFVFCPVSIYFHHLLGQLDGVLYYEKAQIEGKQVHKSIDLNQYSTSSEVITSLDVCSNNLGIIGKIDVFHCDTSILVERKKHIKKIYDGQIFQIYAQYYCMKEMGYLVKRLRLYSYDDNRSYEIPLPEEDALLKEAFFNTLDNMRTFNIQKYRPNSVDMCRHCIYEEICDRSLL